MKIWRCREFSWEWGNRTLLMGIVNVTPDSFCDGGKFYDSKRAIGEAYRQFEDGADLVDIGGESSRPRAESVSAEEEWRRIGPVIEEVAGKGQKPVSVDTVKYEVALKALQAGAAVINDISGLQREPRLACLAADTGAGLVLMHMRGTPQTMQTLTEYENLREEIREFLKKQTLFAQEKGVNPESIALDPGIGFSKTAEQNLALLKHLPHIGVKGYPTLLGVSRKSFVGIVTGKPVEERLMGTAAATAIGVFLGVDIIRAHDVKEMRDVLSVADAIRGNCLKGCV